jgi:predicted DNA-binding protein (MmcQ/YjbR family)
LFSDAPRRENEAARETSMTMARRKVFDLIRAHCLQKPGAVEEYPWDSVVWKVGKKVFAIGALGENAFTVKSTPADQAIITQHPAVEVASYVGRFGWVTVTVTGRDSLDLARCLIDLSYDMVSGKGPLPVRRKKPVRP